MHFDAVQGMAVKDRIDSSQLPDALPETEILSLKNENWFLNANEFQRGIRGPAIILVQRILCIHMPFFRDNFSDLVVHHIKHDFEEEMAKKSETVSLSIM